MVEKSKIIKVIDYLKANKKIAFVIIIVSFILLFAIISSISRAIHRAILENREYSINPEQSEYIFECNSPNGEKCQTRIISGDFTNYNDITILDYYLHECSTSGNKFDCEWSQSLYDAYSSESLTKEAIPDSLEEITTLYIKDKNDIYSTALASKKITIKYTLSDKDKDAIMNASKDYNNNFSKKEEKKAEEESKTKAEEEKKKAEEEAKKKAEEEKKKAEEEAKKTEEEAKKKVEEQKKKESVSEIPNDEITTGIAACNRVSGSKIVKMTNLADSYWGGRDYEWMYRFQASGHTIVCAYNWKTGAARVTYSN